MDDKSVEVMLSLMEAQLEELREIKEFLKPKEAVKIEAKRESIPYVSIVEAYNQFCPSLKRCEVLNDKRRRAIKKLWKTHLQSLDVWKGYFNYCDSDVWFNGVKHHACIDTVLQEDKVVRMFEQGPRSA